MRSAPAGLTDRRDLYRFWVDMATEDFGRTRPVSWSADQVAKAKRICYRCVCTECHWRNYTNVAIPEAATVLPNDGPPSHGGDKNSLGLYQQRQPWWGSIEGMMTPYIATWRFLAGMVRNTPAWMTTDESTCCQNIQQSQFDGKTIDPATGKPYPFASNYRAESARVDGLVADRLYYSHGGT